MSQKKDHQASEEQEISLGKDDRIHLSINMENTPRDADDHPLLQVVGCTNKTHPQQHPVVGRVVKRSECPDCLADLDAEIQKALHDLLRSSQGWSDEELKVLDGRCNTNFPVWLQPSQPESVYPVQDYDWQIKVLGEMNRRMVIAKQLRASSSLDVEEGGEAS
jgi:hypothetical protein